MELKTKRWSLRVTPAQDTIVRQALKDSGMSLNDYVVGCAVAAAADDLAERRVLVMSPPAWEKLQEMLDRPPDPNLKIAKLLTEPSVLD